jgi:hypothetical protein
MDELRELFLRKIGIDLVVRDDNAEWDHANCAAGRQTAKYSKT